MSRVGDGPEGSGSAGGVRIVRTDEPARRAIHRELDRTHFVEAGAGTGKTTAMVRRILELVVTGRARMDEIAAITFTEAAAAELRDRLAESLEHLAAGSPGEATGREGGEPGRSGREEVSLLCRARAAEAVAEVDGAAISTLHGFARRLLAEHPFEAGLPPEFEVLDEVRSRANFDEQWSTFLDELLEDPGHGPSVARALVCGVRIDQVRELADQCGQNWDLVADHPWHAGPPPPIRVAEVLAPLESALELADACEATNDRLLDHLGELGGWAMEVRDTTEEIELLGLMVRSGTLSARTKGQKGNWGGRIDEVRAHLDRAEEARRALVEQVALHALDHLLAAVGELTLKAADERRRDGRLEYHDLLVQARDLLRRRPDVARSVGAQYRYLLIDEFQDTDPIQAELAVRIVSDDPDAGAGDWRALGFEAGRLFFVGDPKQSIYRFRRADIAQFMAVRDRYVETPLQLTGNHRSVPGIIDWVNALFGRLLGAGQEGLQPRYEPLQANRSPHGGPPHGPPVVVIGAGGHEGEPADDVRRREASDIAGTVRRAVAEGWPVGDGGRRARLRDIAILVPVRTGLPILQAGLEAAGVPYRLEATSLVYSSSEVRDLLTTLRSIDDPTDEVATVAALRSPYFGCGDDDLLEFRLLGGHWDYRTPPPRGLGSEHPVVTGCQVLAAFHADRWWCGVSELIDRVVVQRRMLELALDDPRPRETWRRLRFVVDDARMFAEAFGGDLRRYLAWADLQSEEGARVAEVIPAEPDDDAVRIMTIHAAKGLEFPIVVMAGLSGAPNPGSGPRVLWGPEGPEVRMPGSVRSSGFDALAQVDAEMERCERLRLLYVAATRARDHLVVSLHHRAGTECLAARIEAVCTDHPALWRRPDAGDEHPGGHGGEEEGAGTAGGSASVVGPAAPAGAGGTTGPVEPIEPVDETTRAVWQARRAALLERAAVPGVVAATAVAKLARHEAPGGAPEDPGVPDGDAGDEQPAWRRGRAGTAVGRAVHATLQRLDLGTAADLPALAETQAIVEGIPDRAPEVARLARAAVDSDVVREAVAAGRFWRELYVGVPIGGRVLEGFVDLLVEGPDGLEIVDYKTDQAMSEGDLEQVVERYRLQGAAYAVAVETALGRPVTRCTFLFLRPGGAVAREVPDLELATAEVRAVVSSGGPVDVRRGSAAVTPPRSGGTAHPEDP